MKHRQSYLKVVERNADSTTHGSAKILEFAVGKKGEKMHQISECSDMVLVMNENVIESEGMFEVYCRGMLWGEQTPEAAWNLHREITNFDYFMLKIASTNSSRPIAIDGEMSAMSYGNLAVLDEVSDLPSWYISHSAFSCLGIDTRLCGLIYNREAGIDAVFIENPLLPKVFQELGRDYNAVSNIYKELIRNLNYLGSFYYLLAKDVNKDIYRLCTNGNANLFAKFWAMLDKCIAGLYALLLEKEKKTNYNFAKLSSNITSASLSSINIKQNIHVEIDGLLNKTIDDIIARARKSECGIYLTRHRNSRISHFGRKSTAAADYPLEELLEMRLLSPGKPGMFVASYGWQSIESEVYSHLEHCFTAVGFIEECFEAIAAGCNIFNVAPMRDYKDVRSYPRHHAVWDLFGCLPKEKFDIPWIHNRTEIPS